MIWRFTNPNFASAGNGAGGLGAGAGVACFGWPVRSGGGVGCVGGVCVGGGFGGGGWVGGGVVCVGGGVVCGGGGDVWAKTGPAASRALKARITNKRLIIIGTLVGNDSSATGVHSKRALPAMCNPMYRLGRPSVQCGCPTSPFGLRRGKPDAGEGGPSRKTALRV